MKENQRRLKSWQGWLLFCAAVVVVFLLGMLAASVTERRAEIRSIYANKKVELTPFESRNGIYRENYPRQYDTWTNTADTTFTSEYNGSQLVDVLAQRPQMVIFWAGYAFSREYNTPRGHMHAIHDMIDILRTANPGVDGEGDLQPGTCWVCKSPDVPRMMQAMGVDNFYKTKWSELGLSLIHI